MMTSSFQNKTNKIIHWICVPSIMFSLLGLLWSIPSGFLSELVPASVAPYATFATLFVIFAVIFYLTLSFTLTIGMILISIPMLWGNNQIANNAAWPLWAISLIIFFVAWVGQFYGHKVEGKKPSFLKDVQFLLIGPAWLLHFIYKKLGIPY
jgi:uncharacterized membrane protein YGL010W